MRLSRLHVLSFRGLHDARLELNQHTVLVGPNGTGKSSFLHALRFFYTQSFQLSEDDFHAGDVSTNIQVQLTFSDLSDQAKRDFAPYLEGDSLSITKKASLSDDRTSSNQTYHAIRQVHPGFAEIRSARAFREKQSLYNQLRERETYDDLSPVRGADALETALTAWEENNPDACEPTESELRLLGWTGVAIGKIKQHSDLIFIPAVRQAVEEAEETRKSLTKLVIQPRIKAWTEFQNFKTSTKVDYDAITNAPHRPDLADVQEGLTNILKTYAPEAAVVLEWDTTTVISIPDPAVRLDLVEHEYQGPIEHKGHGLQRAFIFALLQFLADSMHEFDEDTSGAESDAPAGPCYVLAIEEPELYQHPIRCRALCRTLQRLAEQSPPGRAYMQVIYASHSPHFVDFSRFTNVRLVRKLPVVLADTLPPTWVDTASVSEVAEKLASFHELQPDVVNMERVVADIQRLMGPELSEGLFANAVCLVEGPSDRAAFHAVALGLGYDLDHLGIAVIPAHGKTALHYPLVIFQSLQIPCYVVFDADAHLSEKDAKPEWNRRLLHYLGGPQEDHPETQVLGHVACFHRNLEAHLEEDAIGQELYGQLLHEACEFYGFSSLREGQKHPHVVRDIIVGATGHGIRFEMIAHVVNELINMVPGAAASD